MLYVNETVRRHGVRGFYWRGGTRRIPPPLQQFGTFRGRIWEFESGNLEWWLTKDRYVVHLTLTGGKNEEGRVFERLINEIIKTIVIKHP